MEQAHRIFHRLTEVEKAQLRAANAARVEYLADTNHRTDLPNTTFAERVSIIDEVKALCNLEFATKSSAPGFGRS